MLFFRHTSLDNTMEPNAFIAEVYRRMAQRHAGERSHPKWSEAEKDPLVIASAKHYAPYLPSDRTAHILDVGFGGGWFLAACLKLGYTNLSGADFGIEHKAYIREWAPDRITLHEIRDNVGEFLSDKQEQYDFVHMSHVIEHIPKYSLLWNVDSLYRSLKRGGWIFLRTPNMEGPCANSALYVTLSHEYGFSGSNLTSLLHICGFEDIRLINLSQHTPTLKQRLGSCLRWPVLEMNKFRHRLFGVNSGGQFGPELMIIGKRGDWPPYFDARYK